MEPEKVTHLPAPAVVREPQAHPIAVSLGDIQRMAQAVAQSGMFGVKTPEQAMSLMLIAQAEGLHPAIAARDYDIIQNRPAKKSEAMLRSFLANGGKVRWHQLDDRMADATFSHPQGGEVRITWDIPRAQLAGLSGKDNYKKFPRQMLRARCISEGVRTVCPMATSGMYVPEEVIDMEPGAPPVDTSTLNEEQQRTIREKCEKCGPTILGNVLHEYGVVTLAEVPAAEFQTIDATLDKMLRKREEAKAKGVQS